VKAATLHRSDFVQQNIANTKTNKFVLELVPKETVNDQIIAEIDGH
jgi:hypothetical protein